MPETTQEELKLQVEGLQEDVEAAEEEKKALNETLDVYREWIGEMVSRSDAVGDARQRGRLDELENAIDCLVDHAEKDPT
jgi:hypothetical protein